MSSVTAQAEYRPDAERLDWSFQDAETAYLTHSIHRYSGKFIPQVAGQAIQLLTKPGDIVFDPYCGSGTTLLECALAGRRAIGTDLNPLAVLISKVKTTPVSASNLLKLERAMEKCIDAIESDGFFKMRLLPRDISDYRLNDPWFTKWFQPQVLADLVRLRNTIADLDVDQLRDIAMLAFSEILRRSSNAHQGYPNVMFNKNGKMRPRPGQHYLRALRQICSAVASLPTNTDWASIRVLQADARSVPLASDAFDAVITHPPYVGSIPYAEYGALSLKWLGHDPKQLDRELTGGQRQSRHVVSRFSADYGKMIGEAFRVLKMYGHLFLLVGNPTVKGNIIDLAQITHDRASDHGFKLTAKTARMAENRRANKMGDETILVYQKR